MGRMLRAAGRPDIHAGLVSDYARGRSGAARSYAAGTTRGFDPETVDTAIPQSPYADLAPGGMTAQPFGDSLGA
jgi:hypothetical protein